MAKTSRKPSKPKEPEVLFLIGRPFVITGGEHGPIGGIVRGQVDDLNYLVELSGELVLVEVETMLAGDLSNPTWRFFETVEQREEWLAAQPAPMTGDAADDQERLART